MNCEVNRTWGTQVKHEKRAQNFSPKSKGTKCIEDTDSHRRFIQKWSSNSM